MSCVLHWSIVMPVVWKAALLLTASNVFMTFAWYAHLKDMLLYVPHPPHS